MDTAKQLADLEATAAKLGVEISYQPMAGLVQGIGGLCKVKGQYRVIIDRRLKAPERAQVIVDALAHFDTSALEVPPSVRRLLDRRPAPEPAVATVA
ncbi:MAG: hypothetical protein B7733_22225 [Myxococcales bacterium FL481]|nr:MAG: hypothetical protein B7733_22225 [Myxococcales bacterium FL481]